MSEKRHSVKVSIIGEEFTIRSDEEPGHIKEVAEYVDRAVRHVLKSSPVIETHKAAILAALQITDELLKAKATNALIDSRMDSLSAEVRRWLPPAKRPESGEQLAVWKEPE
jgi:cell division protein ZapA